MLYWAFTKDWGRDFKDLRKCQVYVCRYMHQDLRMVQGMTESELLRWMRHTSDAIGKESKAGHTES